MKRFFWLAIISLHLLNTGCATFSGIGTDNNPKPSPLVNFTPAFKTTQQWSEKTTHGSNSNFLRFAPAYADKVIYTVDDAGHVSANRSNNGQQLWSVDTKLPLTSSPAATQNYVLVGSQEGIVAALDARTGKQRWRTAVPGQVLAAPVIDGPSAYIKTLDGNVIALDIKTGKTLWTAAHPTPTLILRGSSSPQVFNNLLIVGFADGKLTALDKTTGNQVWERTIAMPQGSSIPERMVDIDVDPIVNNGVVYVATYQGNVAAVDARTGVQIWEHPISSYAGLILDANTLYVSDANSNVWAFARKNGQVLWKQDKLYARRITGPALINNALIVADAEGYLHWLATEDGRLLARAELNKSGIIANPTIADNTVYVTAKNGYTAAYTAVHQ